MNRILLVDNDDAHRETDAEVCVRAGFEVISIGDPEQAVIELPSLEQLLAVLSDKDMPFMDGRELLRIVRDTRPEVKRILMSARVERGVTSFEAESREICAPHLFIPKPVPIRELRAGLETLRDPS